MTKFLRWLDSIPLVILFFAALFLGLAPFVPQPHLVEKMGMLANGALYKPIDIFDLCYHGLPVALLVTRLIRLYRQKNSDNNLPDK